MPFQKGNKLGGRTKGTESEATKLLKTKSAALMKEAIKRAMDGNDPLMNKLIDKIAPTLQHTQLEAEIYNELSSLTNDELQEKINEIEGRITHKKT